MADQRIDLGNFSLATPPQWSISSLILMGPPEAAASAPKSPGMQQGGFRQNLVVVSEEVDAKETLQAYVQKQTGKLQAEGVMHRPPGPLEKLTLAGNREGVLFEHVVLGPTGEKVRQMQLIVRKEGTLHALIASHLDGLPFETQRETFLALLKSVHIG